MDGIDARHAVGWSIFGLTIIALGGAVAANRVMVAGVEAAQKVRQTQAVRAISTVHQRTQQWPVSEKDPMLDDGDRSRVRESRATFKLVDIQPGPHRATYDLSYSGRSMRVSVP